MLEGRVGAVQRVVDFLRVGPAHAEVTDVQVINEDERIGRAFDNGHLPKIDVDIAALVNSRPAA